MESGDDTSAELSELQCLLESDLWTLYKLVYTYGVPVAEGDIRAASAILRRWLCDGLIGQLCNELRVTATFPVLDNDAALTLASENSKIDYFLTAGVKVNGTPLMFVYNSSAPPEEHLQFLPPSVTVKSSKGFLTQRRVYFEGSFFTCRDIILFTANKLGGVHHDIRRDERQTLMQRASEFMTFGGPPERAKRNPPGQFYFDVEPGGSEILSGFHLEIIAAASSFLNLHLNGQQLFLFPSSE